ncbi:unnamed protein product, partial [Didymodactylos carnosus]
MRAQSKILAIRCADRSHIVCIEEFIRGYVQALAEVDFISFAQRDELYSQITEAV